MLSRNIIYALALILIFYTFLVPIYYAWSLKGLLVTEVILLDQNNITRPEIGDRLELSGVWIIDRHSIGPDWNEIHPVRYIKNLNTLAESGTKNYSGSLFQGMKEVDRLSILDSQNPYRTVRGRVVDVFTNPEDGDWHVHLLPDLEYQGLTQSGPYPVYLPIQVAFLSMICSFLLAIFCAIIAFRKKS
ncbi:hypothetical protein HZC07_05120 [Candidatus Micrarchaeota archaeon]|nr:hypothetical protein [Candidatus Micrarchaeota archaeon]